LHLVWNDTRTGKLDRFAATVHPPRTNQRSNEHPRVVPSCAESGPGLRAGRKAGDPPVPTIDLLVADLGISGLTAAAAGAPS
jgi:hypothetical protein